MRARGAYRIKLKAEVLPLKDEVGGYLQFGLSQGHDADKGSMATLTHIFPALAAIKKSDDERISLVNGGIVEEVPAVEIDPVTLQELLSEVEAHVSHDDFD